MASDSKTFLDDADSLKALVERMPERARDEYMSYGALSLESAFPRRKMVTYKVSSGKPIEPVIFSFGSLSVDWDTGPAFTVQDDSGASTRITCVPSRLQDRDVFLHVPQNFTLKYKGRRSEGGGAEFISHYAVLTKTRSKEIHQVEGHTYCVRLNQFHERFPEVHLRY